MNSKKNKLGPLIAAVVVILIVITIGFYNSLVTKQTDVEEKSANISTQLQRRADLIPNLVKTVKGYTTHENEVFDKVNSSREQLVNAKTMKEKADANQEITSALNNLIAIAESYPDLKSDTVYIGLMDELAGTENRIAIARTNYNKVVTTYNKAIRRFPTNIFAGIMGFNKEEYFEPSENAAVVPEVNIN